MKWSAFDFNHNCFSIRHTVTTCNVKGERVTIKKDKAKNKSSLRTYPLIPFLKERLLEAKKQQEENRKLCGRAYNKEYLGYVCVDVIGNLIKPNYVSSTFGKLLAKNNLRHIRFHDLRHTCASLLLANGVPMESGKGMAGTTVRFQQRWIFTGICNMPRKNNPPQPLSRTLWRPCCKTYRRFLHKKERGLPAFRWQTSWRRWRDSNSRAGLKPTYRIFDVLPASQYSVEHSGSYPTLPEDTNHRDYAQNFIKVRKI